MKVFNERYSNDNRLKLNGLPSLNYSRNILDNRFIFVRAFDVVCSWTLLRATSEFYWSKVAALRGRKYIEIFTWFWIMDCKFFLLLDELNGARFSIEIFKLRSIWFQIGSMERIEYSVNIKDMTRRFSIAEIEIFLFFCKKYKIFNFIKSRKCDI